MAKTPQDYEDQLNALRGQLAQVGFMTKGSVVRRHTTCGKAGCRCQADPPTLHGPYWQWSTAAKGKTITRRITEQQATLYKEWVANRRRALRILAQIEELSRRAEETLLLRDHPKPAPRQDPQPRTPQRQRNSARTLSGGSN